MPPLSSEEAQARLNTLDGWKIEDGQLVKTYECKSFPGSLNFVNRLGERAERAGHHPDIDIRYSRVRLSLVTHDAGGLTPKDFELASQADEAFWG